MLLGIFTEQPNRVACSVPERCSSSPLRKEAGPKLCCTTLASRRRTECHPTATSSSTVQEISLVPLSGAGTLTAYAAPSSNSPTTLPDGRKRFCTASPSTLMVPTHQEA